MAAEIGKIGIWNGAMTPAAAQELERLGCSTLWIASLPGTSAGELARPEAILAVTDRLVVATGIIDVWSNPADVVAASAARLREAYPGRFLLGLGSSHAPVVETATGQAYEKPLQRVAAFLDELDVADPPVPADERVLAALGPRALRLAAERASGAHPYLVTPEHTARAREIMGAGPVLAPEQKVVVSTDPTAARAAGRRGIAIYLDLPNYLNNLRRLGFGDDDFADGGSDRLVDALVAWGDLDTVKTRIDAHLDAGADHVAVQVLSTEDEGWLPFQAWRDAAPLLER